MPACIFLWIGVWRSLNPNVARFLHFSNMKSDGFSDSLGFSFGFGMPKVIIPQNMPLATHTHTHNHFTALFPGLPGWAPRRKSSSRINGARGDIRGKHTDNPDGRHSIQTNHWPTSNIPIFTLDALPAASLPIYSGLGQAPKTNINRKNCLSPSTHL